MNGNPDSGRRTRGGAAGLKQRRYYAVDGGAGAHRLAALARCDPRLQPAESPRNADLLLVVGPFTDKLAPSIAELAGSLPRPTRVLCIAGPAAQHTLEASSALGDSWLAQAPRIEWRSCTEVVANVLDIRGSTRLAAAAREPDTIAVAPRERELETEDVVLSLGPVQPFTAGPLRVLLVCDGEQVIDARIEAGYAHRGIDAAMRTAPWDALVDIAEQFDPLAPASGRLACVTALENLAGWQSPVDVARLRDAALAIERATNHCWWLTRFARLVAAAHVAEAAYPIAAALDESDLWRPPPQWVAVQRVPAGVLRQEPHAVATRLRSLGNDIAGLHARIARDRLLDLRIRQIGTLGAHRAREAGISGPVLEASEQLQGDVKSRVLVRAAGAQRDLIRAAGILEAMRFPAPSGQAPRSVQSGRAETRVDGPRGRIELVLDNQDGTGPAAVAWRRPSAALLAVVPELLRGQKLADAQVTLASLDLSMAEADG